jgi:hypothetical protein
MAWGNLHDRTAGHNWSAQFFLRSKPFNDAAIQSLFDALPATVKNAGGNLFSAVRRVHKGKKYSAIGPLDFRSDSVAKTPASPV